MYDSTMICYNGFPSITLFPLILVLYPFNMTICVKLQNNNWEYLEFISGTSESASAFLPIMTPFNLISNIKTATEGF